MSWLARSLANSLRLDDPLDDVVSSSSSTRHLPPPAPPPPFASRVNHDRQDDDCDTQSDDAQSRGVKEDLSEFGQTLTRQFWDVASFLAPPPIPSRADSDSPRFDPRGGSNHSGSSGEEETSDSAAGIRNDFAGIGGRFRSGVSEMSRMATNLITVGEEEECEVERGEGEDEEVQRLEEDREDVVWERNEESEYFNDELDDGNYDDEDAPAVVGITHEVLAFARNIAMHPETWLDFPLDEEEDPDDFDMSEAQQEHALAIEQFSPRLAALRIELCPCHMSLGYFWKVYFVLLHSRLNKYDSEILSTPQVMEARAKWMHELHVQTKPDPDYSARSISSFRDESNSIEEDDYCPSEINMPFWSFSSEPTVSYSNTEYETEKHHVASTEIPFIDKSVIEEEQVSRTKDKYPLVGSSSKIPVPDFEDEDDRWLEDEDLDLQGYENAIIMGNEDDISFSDLENDDDLSLPKKSTINSEDYGASLKKS